MYTKRVAWQNVLQKESYTDGGECEKKALLF